MKEKELTEAQKLRKGAENWIRMGAVGMLAGIFLEVYFAIWVGIAAVMLGICGIVWALEEEEKE